jgi:hypothetical protein
MATAKKDIAEKVSESIIVTDKVKSYADDPTFLKRAAEAREALLKTDLSILNQEKSK